MHQRFRPLLCPECEYDQRGLDPIHLCPECGFEFNPNLAIYRAVSHRVHLIPIILGVAMILIGGIAPILLINHGNFSRAAPGHWLVMSLGLLVCLGAWDGILGYRWRYVVIGLDDLHLSRGAEHIQIAWADVKSVTLWPTMVVTVRPRHGRRSIRVRGVFETWDQARQFANLARRRIRECGL
jgi:hypothetical protein